MDLHSCKMAISPQAFNDVEARSADDLETKLDLRLISAFRHCGKRAEVTLSSAGIHPNVLDCVVQRFRAVGWTVEVETVSDPRDGSYYLLTFIRR